MHFFPRFFRATFEIVIFAWKRIGQTHFLIFFRMQQMLSSLQSFARCVTDGMGNLSKIGPEKEMSSKCDFLFWAREQLGYAENWVSILLVQNFFFFSPFLFFIKWFSFWHYMSTPEDFHIKFVSFWDQSLIGRHPLNKLKRNLKYLIFF